MDIAPDYFIHRNVKNKRCDSTILIRLCKKGGFQQYLSTPTYARNTWLILAEVS